MGASTDSIRAVSEADLLDLAKVARSTWQNWCRQDLLAATDNSLYDEEQVVEVLVARLLVEALGPRRARSLDQQQWHELMAACVRLPLNGAGTLDAVVDLYSWDLTSAGNRDELFEITHRETAFPTARVVVPLAHAVRECRAAFWRRAVAPAKLAADGRRRKPQTAKRQVRDG